MMLISDADVERYAGFIAGHQDAVTDIHRQAARAVLGALAADKRLLTAEEEARLIGSVAWASVDETMKQLAKRGSLVSPEMRAVVDCAREVTRAYCTEGVWIGGKPRTEAAMLPLMAAIEDLDGLDT